MEAMTHARAVDAIKRTEERYGSACVEEIKKQERIVTSTREDTVEGMRARARFNAMFEALMSGRMPRDGFDPNRLKTAAGLDFLERQASGRMAMVKRQERIVAPWILANALQDTVHQDVANGNVKKGAALPKRKSVAETPQNGAKA